MKKWMAAVALALVSVTAQPVEVAGVNLDDRVQVGDTVLVLNGAGLRTVLSFVSVYVGALYLPQKSSDANGIMAASCPRRLLMVMKRGVEAEKMLTAFHEGLATHFTAAELQAVQPRLDELDSILRGIKSVQEGDRLSLDFAADGSIRIGLNDEPRGSIRSSQLTAMLLGIWLGEHPVQENLRKALLGL